VFSPASGLKKRPEKSKKKLIFSVFRTDEEFHTSAASGQKNGQFNQKKTTFL
jgi:hypothetical protein